MGEKVCVAGSTAMAMATSAGGGGFSDGGADAASVGNVGCVALVSRGGAEGTG